MGLQKSREDYLEAILIISNRRGSCRSIDVAEHLGFQKSSVSVAVNKLKENGLLKKDEKGFLFLTEEGRHLAKKIYERHITITSCLIAIGVDAKIAEEDACRIEHVMSDESFQKIRLFSEQICNQE
ncbi:iron-dependent repressor [Lachnospiraceae bacterium KM106-2]|nr:iron-dependent repressor [Lachnospiraceae bacterium KM106-2]